MARKRTTAHSSGYTILIVDDQEEVLSSARSILERAGHQVVTAQGGEEALGVFQTGAMQLMLVDYFMPDMTGEEVIHAIRQQDKDIQILLQTGYAGEKPPREMLRTLDIQGYHDKSEGPDQLRLWVDVALKAYRQLQQVRETERLKARLLLKEEVLASLCRAMHLPLQAIFQSSSRLLRDESLPPVPECRQWTERIQRQSHFLEFLVDDLLNFAELETRDIQVTPQPLQIAGLEAEIQELMDFLLRGKSVTFSWQVSETLPLAWADKEPLLLILRNLLSNAAKFTTHGEIRVLATPEADGSEIALQVVDTGIGIAAEYHAPIFELFRQANEPTARRQSGAGIGLTLARKLARLMEGDISLKSRVGEGTCFTLRLRVADALSHYGPSPGLNPAPPPDAESVPPAQTEEAVSLS